MKINKVVIVFLLILTLVIGGKKILMALGEEEPQRISKACEKLSSGALIALDNGDGLSKYKTCPKGTREVVIGDGGAGMGEVVFSDYANGEIYVLKRNMEVWVLNGEMIWQPHPEMDLTFDNGVENIMIEDIIQWGWNSFLTIDGNVYFHDSATLKWRNMGIPIPELP